MRLTEIGAPKRVDRGKVKSRDTSAVVHESNLVYLASIDGIDVMFLALRLSISIRACFTDNCRHCPSLGC